MNPLDFILKLIPPSVLLAITAAAVAVAGLFFYLYRSEATDYANFKSDVEAQSALLKAEAERAKAESERVDADTNAGWQAAVAYWREHGGIVRVRSGCGEGALRPVPGTPFGPEELHVEEPRLSATIDVAECEARINYAIEDAAYIEHVKAWVEGQHNVR